MTDKRGRVTFVPIRPGSRAPMRAGAKNGLQGEITAGGVITKGALPSGVKHMKCRFMYSREWVVITGEGVRTLELKTEKDRVVDRVGKAIQVKDLLFLFGKTVLGDQVISNNRELAIVGAVVVASHGTLVGSLPDKIMEFTNSVASPISEIGI